MAGCAQYQLLGNQTSSAFNIFHICRFGYVLRDACRSWRLRLSRARTTRSVGHRTLSEAGNAIWLLSAGICV